MTTYFNSTHKIPDGTCNCILYNMVQKCPQQLRVCVSTLLPCWCHLKWQMTRGTCIILGLLLGITIIIIIIPNNLFNANDPSQVPIFPGLHVPRSPHFPSYTSSGPHFPRSKASQVAIFPNLHVPRSPYSHICMYPSPHIPTSTCFQVPIFLEPHVPIFPAS